MTLTNTNRLFYSEWTRMFHPHYSKSYSVNCHTISISW